MLSWLRRRRKQAERIEAEADALISDLGDRAYVEARRREREPSSDEMEQEWRRIALAIAHKTGKSVGLDMATRKATDADFSVFDDGTEARTNRTGHQSAGRTHADHFGDPGPAPVSDSVRRGRRRTRDIGPEGGQVPRLRSVRSRPGGLPLSLASSRHRLPFDRPGARRSLVAIVDSAGRNGLLQLPAAGYETAWRAAVFRRRGSVD